MNLTPNDYYEPEHFRAICEDNVNVSRTCEYEKNDMHHIHDSCELLFVEEGEADYFISGNVYHVEKGDVLIIGSKEHHLRKIVKLPFLRYGFTIRPAYLKSFITDTSLLSLFKTPTMEMYNEHCKCIDKNIFNKIVDMLCELKNEYENNISLNNEMQKAIITEISITLFRVFKLQKDVNILTKSNERMQEIKNYIDENFNETLDLNTLSSKFFLHPSTISKEFNKYSGYSINKYINVVRVCEAAKRLEGTSQSIVEISENCGFNSVNTFLRQFRSIMETSPLQYRKSIHESWKRNIDNKRAADIK